MTRDCAIIAMIAHRKWLAKSMDSNVIDMQTRKAVEHVENVENETIQRFMKRWSKSIKDGRFKSVFIIAIDENNLCDWGRLSDNDLHTALAAMLLEDIRQELKEDIFGVADMDDEE